MKATCPREGLLSACQLAGAAVSARDLNPVLRNLKAVADTGRFTLLATDLELSIRLDVLSVLVEEPGEALVPAAKLTSILRESGDPEVRLEADTQACIVRGEHAEFEMPGEDPAHFPDVPAFPDGDYHEVSAGVLRTLIRRVSFAADKKEGARPAMTGVLWEFDDKVIRLIATDGRRLALASGPATVHGSPARGQMPVVPVKAVELLERTLSDPDETVKVCLRPNEVLFRTERATICSRLVEGRYPNYRDVFPKKHANKIPLVVGPFLAAVRQAAIMVDEEGRRVGFTFGNNALTLQAQGRDVGRSKVQLPVEFDGKPVTINFNPAYLVDMLRALDSDAGLTAEVVDGTTVGVFKLADEYSYLVMPLS